MFNAITSVYRLLFNKKQSSIQDEIKPDAVNQTDNLSEETQPLSEPVPQPILAFRTATILLNQFLTRQTLPQPNLKLTIQQCRELQLANAFAHIAVAGCDTVAISTYISHSSLRIIALATGGSRLAIPETSINKEIRDTVNMKQRPTKFQGHYRFSNLDTPDFMMKDDSLLPIIAHTPNAEMGGQRLETQLYALQKAWSPLSLPTHLWVLSKLLVGLEEQGPHYYEVIMEYTIAMCHQKIFRRLKHDWSDIFHQCLQETNGFTFKCTWMPEEASRDQHASDHDFMTVIANIDKSHPDWALNRLIPNLISMSMALPTRGTPLSLYTRDTYTEFHNFLCLLLKQFRALVEDLHNLTKPQPGQPDKRPDIQQLVGKIFVLGYALWKMAKGYAFEVHMRNIENLLVDPRSSWSRSSSNLATVSDGDAEVDMELEAALPLIANDRPVSLWRAYRDWVLLLVVQFESVSVLRQFVRSPNFNRKPISVDVLIGRPVSKEFIPLDEYFKSEYFPADTATKERISNFVATALSLKKQHIFAADALESWDQILAATSQETRRQLCDRIGVSITDAMRDDAFHGHPAFLQDIKALLHQWQVQGNNAKHPYQPTASVNQDRSQPHLSKEEVADEISQKLKEMVDVLDEELVEYGSVADIQANFSGTLHCEAILASLLDPQTRQSLAGDNDLEALLDHAKDFGRILGLSKHPCPTCHYFLSLLSPDSPFITRRPHGTITACTLPMWSAENVVRKMNSHFGSLLRDEILERMQFQSKVRKGYYGLQNWQTLSTDSFQSDIDSVPTFSNTKDLPL